RDIDSAISPDFERRGGANCRNMWHRTCSARVKIGPLDENARPSALPASNQPLARAGHRGERLRPRIPGIATCRLWLCAEHPDTREPSGPDFEARFRIPRPRMKGRLDDRSRYGTD